MDIERLILLQRADLSKLNNPIIGRLIRRLAGYFKLAGLESFTSRRRIRESYMRSIKEEYESISMVLPPVCKAVLDIGAGIGGIDIFISRHYRVLGGCQITLLNKSEISKSIYYDFNKKASFYSSLSTSEIFYERMVCRVKE